MNAASATSNDTPASATSTIQKVAELAGRLMLSSLFLISGLGKLGAYAATAAFMASVGVPGALLPLVIATEVLGAIAVIVGWKTRIAAFLLAGFSLLTALVFHNHLADQNQATDFLKDVAIAGGFILLVVNGAGRLSLDRRSTT
jgi:putative oxidoreductase